MGRTETWHMIINNSSEGVCVRVCPHSDQRNLGSIQSSDDENVSMLAFLHHLLQLKSLYRIKNIQRSSSRAAPSLNLCQCEHSAVTSLKLSKLGSIISVRVRNQREPDSSFLARQQILMRLDYQNVLMSEIATRYHCSIQISTVREIQKGFFVDQGQYTVSAMTTTRNLPPLMFACRLLLRLWKIPHTHPPTQLADN